MTIFFYQVDAPYGCFSNFSPHGFMLQGHFWPSVEHFYQTHKYVGTSHLEICQAIQQAKTAREAAELGRSNSNKVRADWEQVKLIVMRQGVLAKFQTHLNIRAILLGTGESLIVEDSTVDSFWGCGADRQGQNHLGKILMSVRQQLHTNFNRGHVLLNG